MGCVVKSSPLYCVTRVKAIVPPYLNCSLHCRHDDAEPQVVLVMVWYQIPVCGEGVFFTSSWGKEKKKKRIQKVPRSLGPYLNDSQQQT